MQTEVAVAELEPGLAAELVGRGERVPGLLRASPATLLVAESGQRVEDAAEVGRHVQAEHLEVVADVDDRGHARGIDRLDDAAQETSAPDAAREHRDLHVRASSLRYLRVNLPTQSRTRSRSSCVSTSSRMPGSASRAARRWSANRCALPGP